MTDRHDAKIEVLYNAQCPVCNREIEHYARLRDKQNLQIGFTDLNDPDGLRRWDIDDRTAAQRLHVRKGEDIYDGIPAFIELWKEMPQYRWLARVVSLPGIHRLAVWTYDLLLAPLLYRWHLRRIRSERATS